MRLQKRRRFEPHGAQPSETPCFNMVAERANGSNGRSDSEREGSVQHDLPGKQQRHIPERELQRQRFLRIRRIDSRDIQNKFNNNVQSTVGPVPSEPNHLGLERAQFEKTSPKFLPMKISFDGEALEGSARTASEHDRIATGIVTVCSEVDSKGKSQERGSETSWSAFHKSGGRNSTKSKSSDKSSKKSSDKNYEKSSDKNNIKSTDNDVDQPTDRHSEQVAAKHNSKEHKQVQHHLHDERLRDHEHQFRDERLRDHEQL